jgi:hypothetical protein
MQTCNARYNTQHAAVPDGCCFGLLSVRTDAQAREAEGVPAERILGEVMLDAATAVNSRYATCHETAVQHRSARYNMQRVQQSC